MNTRISSAVETSVYVLATVMTSIIAIADPGSLESIKAALSHEH